VSYYDPSDRRNPDPCRDEEKMAPGHLDSGVIVLGSCGGWPEPGRACSGYLVTHRGFSVVLDLGTATAPALLRHGTPDAVVVTHAHPDHAADLHALFRSARYGRPVRIPVFAAAGVAELMAAMDPPDAGEVASVLDFRGLPAQAGPFRVTAVDLPHHVPAMGVRLEADGLTVAYTGDTGPSSRLGTLGRDADLFIVDSTNRPGPSAGLNLTARQAGQAARAARCRRLLLTHFWPGIDRDQCRREAAEAFRGEILIADEGLEIPLG